MNAGRICTDWEFIALVHYYKNVDDIFLHCITWSIISFTEHVWWPLLDYVNSTEKRRSSHRSKLSKYKFYKTSVEKKRSVLLISSEDLPSMMTKFCMYLVKLRTLRSSSRRSTATSSLKGFPDVVPDTTNVSPFPWLQVIYRESESQQGTYYVKYCMKVTSEQIKKDASPSEAPKVE